MRVETEGLVLKQVNTVNNRKILVLFTKKFGKISAGTNLGDRSRMGDMTYIPTEIHIMS